MILKLKIIKLIIFKLYRNLKINVSIMVRKNVSVKNANVLEEIEIRPVSPKKERGRL